MDRVYSNTSEPGFSLTDGSTDLARFEDSVFEEWPVLTMAGELDVSTGAAMTRAIARHLANSDRLIIDLRGVTFVDSRALAVLIRTSQQTEAGALRLVTSSPRLLKLFELSGVSELFEVFESVEAAVAPEN